jgi:hypothetical protein
MATEFRKGSMGAAEEKNKTYWIYGSAVVYILILLCLFVFNTDLHDFARRASFFMNLLGFLLIAGSYGVLYLAIKNESGKTIYIAGFAVLLALGICTACGFNFDYFGLDK